MNLQNIVIVLDHPDEPRNIGAACRAMANNDIKDLRIVGKKENYDEEKVHTLAIHAGYIYDNAKFFDDINAATADCTLSAGTTRRRGKNRGRLLLPEEFAEEAAKITGDSEDSAMPRDTADSPEDNSMPRGTAGSPEDNSMPRGTAGSPENNSMPRGTAGSPENNSMPRGTADSPEDNSMPRGTAGRVAVVFGNERTGLTDEQLDMCTIGVTIPSSEDFGSLNLSHAVQIMCYHLFRCKKNGISGYTPLPLERLDKTVKTIADNLQKIGFFKVTGRDDMEIFWRSVLARAALSESEAQYIEKTFCKMSGLAGKNKNEN